MFGLLLRGVLFLSIVAAYTMGVWNLIENYFLHEFKKYLSSEFKVNKYANPKYLEQTQTMLKSDHYPVQKCNKRNFYQKFMDDVCLASSYKHINKS